MDKSKVLSSIPDSLKNPLLEEYNEIVKNYMEKRWAPSELSGGKFCEIVYTILEGYSISKYPSKPTKPKSFVDACKSLESKITSPRSLKILIPRMLPALYEIRNNRGVGHVGGDVDPNHMDATAVLSMCNWVLAELVRVFHNIPIKEAQQVVDSITERRIPLIWESGGMKRVLNPKLQFKTQILLLLASSSTKVDIESLKDWLEPKDEFYFRKILRQLHKSRIVELSKDEKTIEILPPGSSEVQELIQNLNK